MYLWPVKLTPKQGVFGPLSFRWIFFSVFMLLNDLYSNFTHPLEKQISIKQDTFWTHVKKGRRTLTANFDFAMNFDWLNNLFSFPVGSQGNFAKKIWSLEKTYARRFLKELDIFSLFFICYKHKNMSIFNRKSNF